MSILLVFIWKNSRALPHNSNTDLLTNYDNTTRMPLFQCLLFLSWHLNNLAGPTHHSSRRRQECVRRVRTYTFSPRIKDTSTWVATYGNPECKQERRVLRPGLQGYEGFCLSTPRWLLLVPSPFPLWRTHSLFVLASWEVLYEFYEIVSLAFHFIQWIPEVKMFSPHWVIEAVHMALSRMDGASLSIICSS